MEYKSSFSKDSSEMDIYAIVLYRDNESSIGKCISSLTFCFDKILLINTGSADSSNDIIDKKKKHFNGKIIIEHYTWSDDFSSARNFALSKITSGWCCFFDSDEWISKEESTKLISTLDKFTHHTNIKNCFLSPVIDNNGNIFSFTTGRFFIKESGLKFTDSVHEEIFQPSHRKIENIRANITINHDGYITKTQTKKANRNHKLVSRELSKKPLSIKYKFYMHRLRIQKCTSSNYRNIFSALHFLKFISLSNKHTEYSIELAISILVFSIKYRTYDSINDLQNMITPLMMTLDILYMLSIARIDREDSLQDILYFLNKHRTAAANHPLSYLQLDLKKIDDLILFCTSNIKNNTRNN